MFFRKRYVSRTDAEWIQLEGERARKKGKPLYLAHERRRDWKEPLPLYLWHCAACDVLTVSHPQGYGRIQCPRKPVEHRVRVPTWRRFRDRMLRPAVAAFPPLFLLAAVAFCLAAVFYRACQ